jgi:hypothetical protein
VVPGREIWAVVQSKMGAVRGSLWVPSCMMFEWVFLRMKALMVEFVMMLGVCWSICSGGGNGMESKEADGNGKAVESQLDYGPRFGSTAHSGRASPINSNQHIWKDQPRGPSSRNLVLTSLLLCLAMMARFTHFSDNHQINTHFEDVALQWACWTSRNMLPI